MKELTEFKQAIKDYEEKKSILVAELKKQCKKQTVAISRRMGKSDGYLSNTLYKRDNINDKNLIMIAEALDGRAISNS